MNENLMSIAIVYVDNLTETFCDWIDEKLSKSNTNVIQT